MKTLRVQNITSDAIQNQASETGKSSANVATNYATVNNLAKTLQVDADAIHTTVDDYSRDNKWLQAGATFEIEIQDEDCFNMLAAFVGINLNKTLSVDEFQKLQQMFLDGYCEEDSSLTQTDPTPDENNLRYYNANSGELKCEISANYFIHPTYGNIDIVASSVVMYNTEASEYLYAESSEFDELVPNSDQTYAQMIEEYCGTDTVEVLPEHHDATVAELEELHRDISEIEEFVINWEDSDNTDTGEVVVMTGDTGL